jgi:peptidoglycan hydrolase-like protein with peptidoglycan-binding domain
MRYALLVVSLAACAHATTTSQPSAPQAEPSQRAPAKGERSGGPQSRLERTPKKPGETLVTSSPAGLLEKGAAEKIQAALTKHGVSVAATGVLDEQTSEALRKFQKSQDIAEHGQPDELTLTRLGLDPAKIYRSNAQGDKEKNAKREAEKH